MNDVAILEDGIELLHESTAAQDKLNREKTLRCSEEWKRLSGREHPGEFINGWVWFRYHDWAVAVQEYTVPSHWTETGNPVKYRRHFYRVCQNCRKQIRWEQQGYGGIEAKEVNQLTDIQRAYAATQCQRRKCRKALDSR